MERLLGDERDSFALVNALDRKLVFGTAGLRGKMGTGYGAMNELTVMQATDGLCSYLLSAYGEDEAKRRGIVVGFDHRRNGTLTSERFASLTTAIAISRGIHVHLYSQQVATPLVPFAVTQKNCVGGIMITASHNPGADNGYKVYWENGAQIIPPHDNGIASCIDESRSNWSNLYESANRSAELAKDAKRLYASGLCEDPFEELAAAFVEKQVDIFSSGHDDKAENFPIVYTPMHGVGTKWIERSFANFGLPLPYVVKEQADPDPSFPTVDFPNPEEGADSLNLAFRTASEHDAHLVLANDPDADRLAVAERDEASGEWRVFTGNEIGTLLACWEWTKWRKANPNADASRVVMLASAVSSTHIGMIAESEGFKFEQTLTGFKWMGNRAEELQRHGHEVIFAFEEAIGFCIRPNDFVRDKDGVTTAVIFAEMYRALRNEGKTVTNYLLDIGERYGHCVNRSGYVMCDDAQSIFRRLRNDGQYWSTCGDALKITDVRDLGTGYDSSTPDKVATLPSSPSTQMITYTFDDGRGVATLRTSGTEPKLKCYVEVRGDEPRSSLSAYCDVVYETVLREMVQACQD